MGAGFSPNMIEVGGKQTATLNAVGNTVRASARVENICSLFVVFCFLAARQLPQASSFRAELLYLLMRCSGVRSSPGLTGHVAVPEHVCLTSGVYLWMR
jgi:hypothetical protein